MKLTHPFIKTLTCAVAVIGLALFSVSCEKGDEGTAEPEAEPEAAPAAPAAAPEAAKTE